MAEGAAQWEGLSGAPVGGKGMAPFSILLSQTWQWNLALARVLVALTAQKTAPASNSNSGARSCTPRL